MPKDTWLNLPEEKRERIVRVSLNEFGQRGFSAGSLNVIAREADIAKGSLFQYFEDKLDLFASVCEIGSSRIAGNTVGMVDSEMPFFDMLRDLVFKWIEYFRVHPEDQRWAFAVSHEIDSEARLAVRSVANDHYAKALRPVVERAIANGEIRADADAALVVSMTVLVLRHLDSAVFDDAGDPAFAFTKMRAREVDRVATAYVDALERAFAAKTS